MVHALQYLRYRGLANSSALAHLREGFGAQK